VTDSDLLRLIVISSRMRSVKQVMVDIGFSQGGRCRETF